MSTVKISELTALSSADAADELVIVDDSAGVTKKITHANLANFGTRTVTAGAIDFSGLANAGGMTSELLDDYEEGTWSPIYKTSGTNFASITYNSLNSGVYAKIGGVVFFAAFVRSDSINTSGATGDIQVGNLPFSVANLSGLANRAGCTVGYSNNFAGDHPSIALINESTNAISLRYRTSANGDTNSDLQIADLGTGSGDNAVYISGFYRTA